MSDDASRLFDGALNELAEIGGFSNMVSVELRGSPTDHAGELASMVHAKMCAHARSIGSIAQSPMFDHSAIVGLSRMIVEGLTMYAYLKQSVSEDLWSLRETVLKLHDTVARITLLRAYSEKADYQDLIDGRAELLSSLESNLAFGKLPEEQRKAIRSGVVVFVGGMRRAAREAGWNEDRFTAMYGYLSAHVHGAPMSYFRTREHGVDYYSPSDAQKAIAA